MKDGVQTIAVAGASGFVGQTLCRRLIDDGHRVIALSRSGAVPFKHASLEGRACDLFSLLEVEAGLTGADQAVYLVHSMMPSAALDQASFEDMDAVLADNFARACQSCGVQHVVYLGGLVPATPGLSRHLESRREVESLLAARGTRVTALRAGLVIGSHGSSFRIVTRLAQRLPIMLLPSWTQTLTQPIALEDVIELIARLITTPDAQGDVYDIGGPDVMTYEQLLTVTAQLQLGREPRLGRIPLLTPRLSALWVSLVTQTPLALVKPLVRSLEHPMVARDRRLQDRLGVPGVPFRTAVEHALETERTSTPAPAPARRSRGGRKTARSIQRLPLVPGKDSRWVADEYLRWLPVGMRPLVDVRVEGRVARFYARPIGLLLLELTLSEERSTSDRTVLYLTGGWLWRGGGERRGRLEFRVVEAANCVLAAVHDFQPALPWFVYVWSQALAHLWVMHRFRRHLRDLAAGGAE